MRSLCTARWLATRSAHVALGIATCGLLAASSGKSAGQTEQPHPEQPRRRTSSKARAADAIRQSSANSVVIGDATSTASSTRENTEQVPESALPALPEVPRLESRQPTAEDLQELATRLNALLSEDPEVRENASTELTEVQPRIVPAVHQRVMQLGEHADKERMKRLFGDARRDTLSRKSGANSANAQGMTNDATVLRTLLTSARPKDPAWRDCVTLAALVRMLAASGTVDGARELVTVYAKFGEFIRVEVQQRLADMKDRAIAALIEARRHPAEKVARWAGLRLDQMGRAIPSEAVRTNDFEALGDILRAYGRVRDPDAARIIISFANSERTQLRLAARQAIVMLGSVGLWQLRDAYEDVVGKRPRRDWTWERTARELFGEFDRLRLARVYGTFMEGMRHLEKGELAQMGRAFDLVLAKDPLFEKRSQMAPGYYRLAQSLRETKPGEALQALMRVQRLSSDSDLVKQAQSLENTLRALQATKRGVVDLDRLKTALELDPRNSLARSTLSKLQPSNLANRYSSLRWIASAVIALAGIVSVVVIWVRRPKPGKPHAQQPQAPTETSVG